MDELPLGRETGYADTYDPALLYPIARADGRATLGLGEPLPFRGRDRWTAWELSWLDTAGCPVAAVLYCDVPADSPRLVESKSLKLYLNGFAMTRFDSADAVRDSIAADLRQATGSPVAVRLVTSSAAAECRIAALPGDGIDHLDVHCERYDCDAELLRADGPAVEETLHSHLLRSLCPVTGQPDTGSLLLRYRGPRIDRASLLRYIVSFRRHSDFHELCVERIFRDLVARCRCESLVVYALYNRRGGIDINPYRSSGDEEPPRLRSWRQ